MSNRFRERSPPEIGRPIPFSEVRPIDQENQVRQGIRAFDLFPSGDGKEVADSGSTKNRKPKRPDNNLTTCGIFGPILVMVILDAADGSGLIWSHWEQGADGRRAAFRFAVPSE